MKKRLNIAAAAVAAGLLVFVLTVFDLLSPLDFMARDALYQIPRGIDSRIKIIGIDEKTMGSLGPVQTWSRSVYAELLDKLKEEPAVVAFDIQFSGNVDEGDAAFAKAAEKSGNVVVVEQLIYGHRLISGADGLQNYEVESVDMPYEALLSVCALGFSNVAQDTDGTVRRVIPEQYALGIRHEMFSGAIYRRYCEVKGTEPQAITVDKYGRTMINYSGKPGDYECVSLIDVLEGRIDVRAFRDCIVLVGAYAPGMQDSFNVPNGDSRQMYGVEIHANILQSCLTGRFCVNGSPILIGLIYALIAALAVLLFEKIRPWQSILIIIGVCVAQLVILAALNNSGTSYSIIYLPLVMFVSYVAVLAKNYILEKRRKKKVLDAFSKYVAPQIIEEISKKDDFSVSLGGQNRDIACLFVDIRGFTTMSEALEPEQVVAILNEYLALTTKAIFDNSGTLDKFVGDCTMAVFNSPFDLPDYEFKSVCAAMDIVKGGEALEKTLMEKYGRTVGFGVGVNAGPAVVGNIGCDFRMDFTAIGDTVNTAARLEANAKKGQVLISDVLYERLKGRIEVVPVGEIPLKGKSKGVFVYEVTEVHRA